MWYVVMVSANFKRGTKSILLLFSFSDKRKSERTTTTFLPMLLIIILDTNEQ